MKLILGFSIVLAAYCASAKETKGVFKNRLPAQVGIETIRDLATCDFDKNDLEISKIEVFGNVQEAGQKVTIKNIHTVVTLSVHGGHKMLYMGGNLNFASNLNGKISMNGQDSAFSMTHGEGKVEINGRSLTSKKCSSPFNF